jgi:hypothetical protein
MVALRRGAQRELRAPEETLAGHLKSGNPEGTAVALYRLGRWHMKQREPRAAVDYLIANAALQRVLNLSMDDREEALNALGALQKELPPGTVHAALAAVESGPPPMLAPLLGEVAPARWQWLVRAVAAELEGGQVVEPEPQEEAGGGGFDAWLDHVASMTALIVRFGDRADPEKRARWAATIDETADEISKQVGPQGEGQEVVTLARALAALGRGQDPERMLGTLPPPVTEMVERIRNIAAEPVWRHPGCSPLDFLVEHASQRAVRGLRLHDDYRAGRLGNLAWRFELMTLDMAGEQPLLPIAVFLTALAELMERDGRRAESAPTLEARFDAVLRAVAEAGASSQPA